MYTKYRDTGKDVALNRKEILRVDGSSKRRTKKEETSGLIASRSLYRGWFTLIWGERASQGRGYDATSGFLNWVIGAFGCKTGCIYAHMHTAWPRFGTRVRVSVLVLRPKRTSPPKKLVEKCDPVPVNVCRYLRDFRARADSEARRAAVSSSLCAFDGRTAGCPRGKRVDEV